MKRPAWNDQHGAALVKRPAWSNSYEAICIKQSTWSNPHGTTNIWSDPLVCPHRKNERFERATECSTCLPFESSGWLPGWFVTAEDPAALSVTYWTSTTGLALLVQYWTAHDRRVASGLFAGTAHRSVAVGRHQLSKHQLESVLTVVPPTRQPSLAIRLQCRPKRRLQCRPQRRLQCRLQLC